MKGKFVGVGALLACQIGVAHAAVTLYGVIDTGIEFLTNTPSATNPGRRGSVVRQSSHGLAASRWGMRGTEDLGDGLSSVFILENSFNPDTGSQYDASRLFNFQALVGLQNKYGLVTVGRQRSAYFDVLLRYDPLGYGAAYSITNNDFRSAARTDNAIKYLGTFGSWTAIGLYSFGRSGRGEVPGEPKVDREINGGLMYTQGPLSVGATYDQFNGFTLATKNEVQRRYAAVGTYQFERVRAFLGARVQNGGETAVKTNTVLYWTGLAYSWSNALMLTGAVYHTDDRRSSADPTMFVAAADYSLSKRTTAYLHAGYVKNPSGAALGLNGTNIDIAPGHAQFGSMIGLMHRF